MRMDRVIPEPKLEFGNGGLSCDIREGITRYGPVDYGTPRARSDIKIGLVGTAKSVADFTAWINLCADGIKGANHLNPNMNPDFPGLGPSVGFRVKYLTDPSWVTELSEHALKSMCSTEGATSALAKLFHQEIRALYELTSSKPDVVICLPPEFVMKAVNPRFMKKADADPSEEGVDFHDYLKGLCLETKSVFQLIWPRTYQHKSKEIQDPATRAWNLFGAIFYKAGGAPWKLHNPPSGKKTCYVGISFSVRDGGGYLHTSLTQVFNDKGEGTILRGGLAHKSEEDYEVHLPQSSAQELLLNAIENYRQANNGNEPERVVIHKSSGYDQAELNGFNAALDSSRIRLADCLALNISDIRFFRYGSYPPLRGTHVILDDHCSILYTRGSVPFYRKYPGPYVPRSLQIRYFQTERSQTELAIEILALTKLNWNKTQFDSFYPITLLGSRQIGTVFKWCPNAPSDSISYSFFM